MADTDTRLAVAFVAPLLVYLLLGVGEPKFAGDSRFARPAATAGQAAAESTALPAAEPLSKSAVAKTQRYLVFVWLKLLVVAGILIYFAPLYRRWLPWRGSGGTTDRPGPTGPGEPSLGSESLPSDSSSFRSVAALVVGSGLVGAVGFCLWVGLCQAALETALAARWGWAEQVAATRSHFDPFIAFPSSTGWLMFLLPRLALLVLVVPLAEELFLRGFLLRFLQNPEWTRQDFRQIGWGPLAAGTAYGVLTHPAEALAAAAWFSLVSWWMVRTGSFWSCVLVHAVTNGLLGAYVLVWSQWQLW